MSGTLARRRRFRRPAPRVAGIEVAEPNDATPFLPERRSLKALREAAAQCRGCHLWRGATQTVFGDGRKRSRVMLVGEQPGDREDLAGRPFVGPASRELDRALEAAGIERGAAYLTNVVKHFKFEERGGRRIHQTPKRFEVEACRPWLDEELEVVRPEALVLLGATAAKALFRQRLPGDPAPWGAARLRARRHRERHRSSLLDTARPTRGPRGESGGARRRPARRGASARLVREPAAVTLGNEPEERRKRECCCKDKNAVIYGASGGIGGAMARAFAAEGARVFLTGRTREKLDALAAEIGDAAEVATFDATDKQAVDEHADAVAAQGGLHVSVNVIAHPTKHGTPMVEMDVDEFLQPVGQAVRSNFLTTAAAARHMRASRATA